MYRRVSLCGLWKVEQVVEEAPKLHSQLLAMYSEQTWVCFEYYVSILEEEILCGHALEGPNRCRLLGGSDSEELSRRRFLSVLEGLWGVDSLGWQWGQRLGTMVSFKLKLRSRAQSTQTMV